METATTATINTGSHRTIDLLIGAKDPSKEYCNHYCPHNNTTYKNVCDGDGCIDPTSGWKQNSSVYPWSKVSRTTKNRRIDSHVIEQYGLAGIPLASATISSPAPSAGSDSNAAAAAPASSGSGLALATVPGAVVDAGANTGSGANDGLLAALLASGWQLVHLPSGPAGAGQYLLDPTSGASYHMKSGRAFPSDDHGIGFGSHAGAGAGDIPSTSTPAAAWTPSRGGLGAAAAAGGGGAASAAGSGARDGVKALVPERWQVIWLAAGPAGPGQYLLDPHGQMAPYVEGGNAFASGHGLGFSPYGAAAIPSTFGSYVQGKDASSFAPFGSFPNKFSEGGISTPLHPAPGSTVASKKVVDRLTDLLETSININKQNQDKNNANWNNFKAFAGNVDNSFAHVEGELDGLAEGQKGMKNDIAKNTSDVAKNTSDIAKLKEFQQKYEASHGKS